MLFDDLKELKTGRRELRKFGLLVGGVLAVLGLILWVKGKPHFAAVLVPGAALVLAGLAVPRALKEVYLVWMALALALGFVVSHVILTVFFFLVITPVGLAARLMGKDFLRLKLDRQAPTYWIRRESRGPRPPGEYERQF
jgi:hypothetical protein